jgi:hypothetical protein
MESQYLPPKTPKRDQEGSYLHDDAPKRVSSHALPSSRLQGKGFHPEPKGDIGNHNDTSKSVMIHAGVATIGIKTLSFFLEKPSHTPDILAHPLSAWPLERCMGGASTKVPSTMGSPTGRSSRGNQAPQARLASLPCCNAMSAGAIHFQIYGTTFPRHPSQDPPPCRRRATTGPKQQV